MNLYLILFCCNQEAEMEKRSLCRDDLICELHMIMDELQTVGRNEFLDKSLVHRELDL